MINRKQLSELELRALDFAYEKHAGQYDKAGKPYVEHVIRVALAVKKYGAKFVIAALLHDTVEDCGVSLATIEEIWGKEIALAVDSLSRREGEIYKDFIRRANKNSIGRIVKLADLEDNSSPERIAALPIENQGITKRYDWAKNYILGNTN